MLAASAVARHSTDPSYGIYAYTAREWDTETNLYYYRARYYDPKVGRFQSEDPVRSQAGERTLNLYRYVADNPSNYLDPTGLQWVPPRGADGNPMTTGVQPEANMYGGEAHAYFVGGGAVTVTCKDECGKKRTFRFAKACVGAGLGGSLAAGYVNGIEGRRCRA
jgi:RHS repeat-associated protein